MMRFYRNISFGKTQSNAKIRCKNNNTFQDTLTRQTFYFTSGMNRLQCRFFRTDHIRIGFISTEDGNVRLVPQAPARETHEASLSLREVNDRPFEQFYGDAFHILSYLCAA